MPRRERTPEEIRRLKSRGIIDAGTSYVKIGGFSKRPKHKPWDGYEPPEN